MRTCLGCRERSDRNTLLRLVVSGTTDSMDRVIPDPAGHNPGRGGWIHPTCLDQAIQRRGFNRAFRRPGPFDITAVEQFVTALPPA
ncbi:MAG: YlxR family protein [Actinomycetes bacterium]